MIILAHIKSIYIKQRCRHKVVDFAKAVRETGPWLRLFEKRNPGKD